MCENNFGPELNKLLMIGDLSALNVNYHEGTTSQPTCIHCNKIIDFKILNMCMKKVKTASTKRQADMYIKFSETFNLTAMSSLTDHYLHITECTGMSPDRQKVLADMLFVGLNGFTKLVMAT